MSGISRGGDGRFVGTADKFEILEGVVYHKDELTTLKAPCRICNFEPGNLREHFVNIHSGEKRMRLCPICHEEVQSRKFAFHMKTHSGPVACSECNAISVNVPALSKHFSIYHRGKPGLKAIVLDDEEAAVWLATKEENQRRNASWRTYSRIEQVSTELLVYEVFLEDDDDLLYKHARRIEKECRELMVIPPGAMTSSNGTFFSVWNNPFKIPLLVGEIVEKSRSNENFMAGQFFADPKLPAEAQQPSGKTFPNYHRSHLSAAANWNELYWVVGSYYFTNVVPLYPNANIRARQSLEKFLRKQARKYGRVLALHVPILEPDANGVVPTTDGEGVGIPAVLGTIMIVQKIDGLHIQAWQIFNHNNYDVQFELDQFSCNPFQMLQLAQITPKFAPTDFQSVSDIEAPVFSVTDN